MSADVSATLCRLRQEVAKMEGLPTDLGIAAGPLKTGIAPLDERLHGGLACASLHEIVPGATRDFGAASSFALALSALACSRGGETNRKTRARPCVLWIQTDYAAIEGGDLYAPGFALFGLPMRHLLMLKVKRPVDALWAAEEALKSRAMVSVIAELPQDAPFADLTMTRRLSLAARETESFAFLLRHRRSPLTTSAETRWEVSAASSVPDRFGGLGRPAFALSLVKNRRGPTGRFVVAWDHHERAFEALSLGVAAAPADRSAGASRARTG